MFRIHLFTLILKQNTEVISFVRAVYWIKCCTQKRVADFCLWFLLQIFSVIISFIHTVSFIRSFRSAWLLHLYDWPVASRRFLYLLCISSRKWNYVRNCYLIGVSAWPKNEKRKTKNEIQDNNNNIISLTNIRLLILFLMVLSFALILFLFHLSCQSESATRSSSRLSFHFMCVKVTNFIFYIYNHFWIMDICFAPIYRLTQSPVIQSFSLCLFNFCDFGFLLILFLPPVHSLHLFWVFSVFVFVFHLHFVFLFFFFIFFEKNQFKIKSAGCYSSGHFMSI